MRRSKKSLRAMLWRGIMHSPCAAHHARRNLLLHPPLGGFKRNRMVALLFPAPVFATAALYTSGTAACALRNDRLARSRPEAGRRDVLFN
jgi:hypothetical protein